MAEEPGEAHRVRLVDWELLPSAERDLQRDTGPGEVGVGEVTGHRAEHVVHLVHRLHAGQLHPGRKDGVGGHGEGQQPGRAGERPDAAHSDGVGVVELGQGVPQLARQILGCGLFSPTSHTALCSASSGQ
ncbi:hypothetical protein [Streptomyces hydrogenans]|uniref:hypothetical protein n=1 Tax=Streptomyces hydrogenans TaxID=1873719 RepID=UPI0037F121AC